MVSRAFRALALAVLLATPAPAAELGRVTEIDADQIYQILLVAKVEAEALLADTTMLASLAGIDSAGLREKLPFGDDVVLYFAPGGDLLAWSDKSQVIELGYWELMASSGYNEICARFGYFGLNSICISPDDGRGPYWLKERTSGNPFGLVAGQPVPGTLGAGPRDLMSIAAGLP